MTPGARREYLGYKERVAPGDLVELCIVAPVLRAQ